MKAAINTIKINLSAIVALFLLLLPASVSAAEDWRYDDSRYKTFSGGSGTKDDPYLISTAQDLASLTYMSSFSVKHYTYYEGVYFKQTADIVLNDNVVSRVTVDSYGRATFDESVLAKFKDWIPIGTFGLNNNCYWFKGHYDGGGHSISGIYCYRGDTDNTLDSNNGYDNYLGLFGAVQSGSITNLTVKDCLIRLHDVKSWTKEWRYIGSIVGRADDELISNCHVENSIVCFDDGNDPSDISVGGVVGYCNITGSYSSNYELKNCSFEGKLNVYNDYSSCAPSIGGICGSIVAADGYLNNYDYPVVSNCLARGVIAYNYNNTTNAGETNVYTGGILGKFANSGSTAATAGAYASIYRCTNFVNTDVVANNGNVYAGGLSGYMARCEQSANFGNVTINGYGGTVANVYAGGIGSFVSIDNCANYGSVTLGAKATSNTTNVNGNAYLGALAVCGIGSEAADSNPCHIVNSVSCADVVCANVSGSCKTDAVSVFSNATTIKENVYYYSHNNTATTYACHVPWDGKSNFMKYDNISILDNNANGNIWGQLDAPSSTFYKYIMPLAESSVPSVKLDEKADDIISVIANNNYDATKDNKVSVTLVRGLKQGYWNTVCLPFAVTADNLKAAFGNEVKLETLKDVTVDANGVLTLNFEAATAMEAGKPYIINPSTVSADNTYVLGTYALSTSLSKATGSSNGNDVSMIGSFGKFTLDSSEDVDQYFLQGNKFYHIVPTNPISANGFRCYFTVSSNTAQQVLTLAKIQHANGSATAIKIVKVGNTADGSAIYDLQGIKHDAMSKGVYIKNGKKFVVRSKKW